MALLGSSARGRTFLIRLTGARQLERKFLLFPEKLQSRIRKKAIKQSVKRLQKDMLLNLSGRIAKRRAGTLYDALKLQKPLSKTRKRKGIVRSGIALPTRAELGISSGDKYYWPVALEYGHKAGGWFKGGKFIKARKFARRAIDDNASREIALISQAIRADVIRLGRQKSLL